MSDFEQGKWVVGGTLRSHVCRKHPYGGKSALEYVMDSPRTYMEFADEDAAQTYADRKNKSVLRRKSFSG